MSEQEVEEQISSEETPNDETGEETGTPDKTSNKSNFKKLSESLKSERAEKARLAKAKAELEEELTAWRTENPELITSALSKKSDGIDKGDLALFLVQNPDAKDHLDEVKEYMAEMKNPDIEKAWKYVKPTIAKESETTRDFDIKGKVSKVDVTKLSITDIYAKDNEGRSKYSDEQKKKWRNANA